MQWYYTKDGQQFGPVDEAEFARLLQQGEITPNDLVWNPSLGEKWIPASTIGQLSPSAPPSGPTAGPPPVASGGGGKTHNRDLMKMARESLRTHWGLALGVTFLYLASMALLYRASMVLLYRASMVLLLLRILRGDYIFFGAILAPILLNAPLMVGRHLVFLNLARQSPAKVGQLFYGFKRFGTSLIAWLLVGLTIAIGTLLLIVPGIIVALSYAMTFFIIADDPTVGPILAMTASQEIMRGNKWKLFCLFWRFFGWYLLCFLISFFWAYFELHLLSHLTLGIGFLWLALYVQTSLAHFYEDVRTSK